MISSIVFVFLLCISDSESVMTLKHFVVKRGGTLTIPCFYDEQYKSHLKYWCKGYLWTECEIVAYTNTKGTTSVTDHPTQNMFTVELNNLQDSDSGYYWCAVEIGDSSAPDDKDYLYLVVSAEPAVSVINSRVNGQEGGSVTVQCFYSARYKNERKQWCRFKDRSCFQMGRTVTSQSSTVLVQDFKKGLVSVKIRDLQKSDAGWYLFIVGGVAVTVHLTVTDTPSKTPAVTTVPATEKTSISETTSGLITSSALTFIKPRNSTVTNTTEKTAADLTAASSVPTTTTMKEIVIYCSNGETRLLWVLLAVGLGLLLILVSVITCMRNKCNGKQTETRGSVNVAAVHTTQKQTPTPENAVIYNAVNKKKSSSVSDHENEVIYSDVTAATKKKTPSQAVRDDEVIYSSLVFN